MKLEEQYPDAFCHFTTADGFIKGSGQPAECVCCDEPTTWYHAALGLHFCSKECHERYEAVQARG
ncbi:MAG TPA: hypothetical protein PK867_08585 [Pirellulales bacterium]|nr:hypothetical protein [Pirellulales bacterium]